MTAIQGGRQRPTDPPPPLTVASGDTTQTPPTGGPLSPETEAVARWPLLLPHRATGDATTRTLTTNGARRQPSPRRHTEHFGLHNKTSVTPRSTR